jgi:hypothetical protein
MKTLIERLWRSPTWMTWGSLGVRLSGIVFILPMVLVRFPPADVAVWQLFSTLITLTLLLDFGLSPTFSRFLAYARGGASVSSMQVGAGPPPRLSGDGNETARVFACLAWLYPRLAGIVLVVLVSGGTLSLIYPINQTADPNSNWLAWGVVACSAYFAMLATGYSAALQGMDHIAELRRWELVTGLGQILTTILAIMLGGNLLALVVAHQAWTIVNFLRNYYLLKSLHPELILMERRKDRELLRSIWPATWRSGIGVMMSHGLIQGSGLIYGQLAPASEVAAYLLALRVITVISQFSQAPFYSKLPRLAELQATGDRATQVVLAERGMRSAHWVFTTGVVAAAFLVSPLLAAIGSRTDFVSPTVWAVIGAAFFVERFGAMHLQLYSLTNHIVWHIANGVSGTLMVIIAIALYPHLGTLAFPVGMLAAYTGFFAVYSVRHSIRALRISLVSFETRVSMAPVCVLGAGLSASVFLAFVRR